MGFFLLGLVGLGDSGVGRCCGCVEDESEGVVVVEGVEGVEGVVNVW